MNYLAIILCLAGFCAAQTRHASFHRARVIAQTPIAWKNAAEWKKSDEKTAESMVLIRDESGYGKTVVALELGMEMPYIYHNVDLRVNGQPIYWTSYRKSFLADGWTKERALDCVALVFRTTILGDARTINWAICSDEKGAK